MNCTNPNPASPTHPSHIDVAVFPQCLLKQLPCLVHIAEPIVEQKQPRERLFLRGLGEAQRYVPRQHIIIQIQPFQMGQRADFGRQRAGELVVAEIDFGQVGEGSEYFAGEVAGEAVLGEYLMKGYTCG